MTNFIVQFLLKTEKYQEDILDKRFEIGREIYNSLVNVTQKRHKEMIKTKNYRNLMSKLSGDKKKDRFIWKQLNDIRKQYGMSEYSFYNDVTKIRHHFSDNIDSSTAQKIAKNLWRAYDRFFYGNGEKIRYKKYGSFNSLEGKSNDTGIRFREDTICWNELKIPVVIDYNNYYECQALEASQFNHFDGTYKKKSLSQRWNDFNGIKVQRDMYSAFLIMNIASDLKSFDIDKCNERFDNFYRLHNLEVERLTGCKI